MPPVPGVGTVIARGAQSAETMQQAGQQAPQTSAFDVWTHSYDGMAARMDDAASDPVGFLASDPAQQARIAAAQMPGQWSNSSIDQAANSIAAQAGTLGDQVQAIRQAQGALQTIGATFALLTGVEQIISSVLSVIPFPAFPAVRITDMDVGLPHGHSHPPNLIPPAPLVPLPSTGPIIPIPILSGAAKTLINGMPAARCGDMGLGIWCGGYFPMYEVFLGSSNVWIEGARAARVAVDITKHCMFTTPKPQDLPLGPMIGMTISSSSNVLIGGVPMPSLTALGMGAAFRGLGKLLGKGARLFGRLTAPLRKKLGARLPSGFAKCKILRGEPVNVVTGEVIVDQQDFSIPGRIPIEWDRHYGSQNNRLGTCGYGWETPADIRLEIDEEGFVVLHQGADGVAVFASLPENEPVMETVDGSVMYRQSEYYSVRLKSGLQYYFRIPRYPVKEIPIHSIADSSGNYLRFVRDEHGLKRVVESAGRHIEVKSADGLIREMRLHHPDEKEPRQLIRYEYDSKTSDIVAVYDALHKPYIFKYQNHYLIQHTDRNGLSFYYEYEEYSPHRRCVHTWGDSGLYDYHLTFNPLRGETQVTNSLGYVSSVEYSEDLLITRETDPLNGITLYEYDKTGRTTAVVDPGNNRTEYEYDARGNLLKLTRPDGKCIETQFNAANKAIKITDPIGAVWQQDWDERGLLIEQATPLGNVSRYEYDLTGQLTGFTNPRDAHTELVFDGVGNLTGLKDALGHATRFVYDRLGNVTSKTDPLGHGTLYRYDAKSRLTAARLPSGATIQCSYDAEDNLTRYLDENGAESRLEYFGIGEIKRRIQPDGHTVEYHYDTEERLVGVTNQRGETYQLKRDALGRIVEEVDYWGQARHYGYDASGYLTASTDPLGRTIGYATNPLGRILKKTLPDGFVEEFVYDANGNLVETKNPHVIIKCEFDAEGRLTEEVQGDFRISNTYDATGNRVARETSFGNTVAYTFDALDQAVSTRINQDEPMQIGRDAVGRIAHERLSPQLSRCFQYSEDGYLTEQAVSANESPLFATRFEYDPAGNLTRRSDSQHSADVYQYDPLGRITEHLDPQSRVTRYLNDPAGDRLKTRIVEGGRQRVVGGGVVDGEWSREGEYEGNYYRFDRAGNLVGLRDEERDLHLVWDANQRLVESHADGTVTRYGYDPLGRRLFKETGDRRTLFYWDGDALVGETVVALNQLKEPLTRIESNVVALDERREEPSGETPQKVREYFYYPETLEPLALIEGAGNDGHIYHYHNDPNGCPTRLTDADGDVKWGARYTAWGGIAKLYVNEVKNAIRLQGQYEDEEIGLCYNRYRYYDSHVGQFVGQDPLSLRAGANLYQYASNAFGWIDPLGLACWPKPVPYGSTALSRAVIAARRRYKNFTAARTNWAAARVRRGGRDITIVRRNQPGGLHAEERLMEQFRSGDEVLEIYTERAPCSNCRQNIGDIFPSAETTYTVPYNTAGRDSLQGKLDNLAE